MNEEKSVFPVDKPVVLCSANVCANGHEWLPVVAVAKCPGCQAPVVAVRMLNCPYCNEPVERFRVRTDHFPGGVLPAMCKGQEGVGEVGVIEVVREHAVEKDA